MKHIVLLLCMLMPFLGLSQSNQRQGPLNAPAGQDRFLLDFHNDLFLTLAPGMEIRPYSPGINASIMYDYPFGTSAISFAWGYGFSSFNIHHNGRFDRDVEEEGFVKFYPYPDGYEYAKNKLSANFVEIPIELRLRTKGNNKFKLYLGGKVGYLVNIHTKIIDEDGKRKYYQLPETSRLRYGATARIGMNRIALFGFYSFSPFLKENKGVELIPVTVGLTFFLI